MNRKLILALVSFTVIVPLARAEETWDASKTWVFMVGVLEWQDASYESYPQKDRRDAELAALFQRRGVPKEQIRFFKDKEATRERMAVEFEQFLEKADGTLIVYYAGHGTKEEDGTTYFIPYDAGESLSETAWAIPSLFDAIEEHFKGERVFLFADCCNSGALSEEAQKRDQSYASLAACRFDSESTGNWTFTESLLAGFGGDPRVDADRDGKTTFGELAKFTELEMAFAEGQLASFSVTKFPDNLVLASAAPLPHPRYGERVMIGKGDDATVARVMEADLNRVKIRPYGYDAKEEWVDSSRVKPWSPKNYAEKTDVRVFWPDDGQWYDATVLDGKLGIHRIHYKGYGDEWDEWVSPDRIQDASP